MSWEAIQNWFLGLGAEYGVNPFIFGAIYVGAIPFFFHFDRLADSADSLFMFCDFLFNYTELPPSATSKNGV